MENTCACGCGEYPRPGKHFKHGHWSRSPEAKALFEGRRRFTEANPGGRCECGCGQQTPVATYNAADRGYYKGQHLRFVPGHHSRLRRGPLSAKWKGGRWTGRDGYVWRYAPDHPRCTKDGYVFEHRLVAEARLGRLLEDHEHVHHINGIKEASWGSRART